MSSQVKPMRVMYVQSIKRRPTQSQRCAGHPGWCAAAVGQRAAAKGNQAAVLADALPQQLMQIQPVLPLHVVR